MASTVLQVGTGVFVIAMVWIAALVFGTMLLRASGSARRYPCLPPGSHHHSGTGVFPSQPRDNSPLQRDRDSRLFVHRPLRLVGRGERGLSGGVLHTAPLSFPGAGLCQGLKNALKLPGSKLAPGSHH
ncbi:transmembrane protein 218 isoform X1 [Larimichthys crocea]|uniref:transmembrane protein 218 isoform X1 n=1 Tax=Larimichthys crocea TaxID=215358 RepID=UPI000F5FF15D|nr:transmembrane protein 218 isoform X1 [Larimichthys crocea]